MNRGMKVRGAMRLNLGWPIIFAVFFLLMSCRIFYLDREAGMLAWFCWLLYVMITAAINLGGRKRLHQDLVGFAANYGQMQLTVMKELDLAYAVLNEEGQLLWGNDHFLNVIGNKKAARRNISNVFPELTYDKLPKTSDEKFVHVQAGERYFKAVMRLVVDSGVGVVDDKLEFDQMVENKKMIALCLYEETEIVDLKQVLQDENMLVGLLYIDNYDELLDSIEENRQSLTMALIDRKVNKYMQEMDAISKKMEKDKFFFVFKEKKLEELKNRRFSILEEIRDINLGNDQNATISIGVGVGSKTFIERYEFARKAMDLALGRGGDQAVVKSGDKEEFFGGKRVEIDRNTRVKARVKAHVLQELIEGNERVVVMGHSIGDADSFGACVGIYCIAKALERKTNIVFNEVTTSVAPMMERFEKGQNAGDVVITGDEAREIVDENTLLVIVDVNKGDYTDCPDLIDQAKSVVVIDHHRQAGDAISKAVLFYIEPYASSSCEMVAEISQYIGNGVRLQPAEAEAMYAGIMVDTNFFSTKTGVRTFEAMAYLRRNGADIVKIRKAFRENLEEYQVKAAAIQDTELYLGEYAIAEGSTGGLPNPTIMGAKIANALLDIKGVKASFVLTRHNKKIYVSARSIDELNVQIMMERLGGGGHINMAGAQLEGKDMEEAKAVIREAIDTMISEGEA